MQSRRSSFLESSVNIVIGFIVSVLAQMLVFPLFGVYVDVIDNILMASVFTPISMFRVYIVRRLFNRMEN